MVNQLAALENALQQEGNERSAVQQELASTRLMLGGLERSREIVQRDAAGASQEVSVLQARRVAVEQPWSRCLPVPAPILAARPSVRTRDLSPAIGDPVKTSAPE